MADTTTAQALLTKMDPGSHSTSWGDVLNLMFDLIEEMAWGFANFSLADADLIMDPITPNLASNTRASTWKFTGALSAPRNIKPPNGLARVVIVFNSATQDLTFVYPAGGASATVPSAQRAMLLLDGTGITLVSTTAANASLFNGLPPSSYAQLANAAAFTSLIVGALTPGAAASFTPDASLANVFFLTFSGGSGTLNNPTNLTDGQELWFFVTGATMSSIAVGTKFKFAGAAVYSGAGHVDCIHGVYNLAADKIYCEYFSNFA